MIIYRKYTLEKLPLHYENGESLLNSLTSPCRFRIELKCLKERCSLNLQRYYESKNHQKKQIQSGG